MYIFQEIWISIINGESFRKEQIARLRCPIKQNISLGYSIDSTIDHLIVINAVMILKSTFGIMMHVKKYIYVLRIYGRAVSMFKSQY